MEYVYHMRDPKEGAIVPSRPTQELVGILDSAVTLLVDEAN
ncbi:MAG TPA: hypothetical protein VNY05_02895 [Candidatus Acidoferrales bacterium]|jgi:hypothetical protein|nr:hypothetical protein [Candidatus Acidoferrales bacterium]